MHPALPRPTRDRLDDADLLAGINLAGRVVLLSLPKMQRVRALRRALRDNSDVADALDLMRRESKALSRWT